MKKVNIITPVYNNQDSLQILVDSVYKLKKNINVQISHTLIDDGSTDQSWKILETLKKKYNNVNLIKLVKNYGQSHAVEVGLNFNNYDAYVVINADLQDPVELIRDMINSFIAGKKTVIGQRVNRNDGFFSNIISRVAWSILKKLTFKNLPQGGFDFYLIDDLVRKRVTRFKNKNIFIQGRILDSGIDFETIPYTRKKRELGKSQYNFFSRTYLFLDVVFGYSLNPFRIISIFGFLSFGVSIILGLIFFVNYFFIVQPLPGWTSTVLIIIFLFSINFLILSIVLEFLWRIISITDNTHDVIIEKIIDE